MTGTESVALDLEEGQSALTVFRGKLFLRLEGLVGFTALGEDASSSVKNNQNADSEPYPWD